MTTTSTEHVHSWEHNDFLKGIFCAGCGWSGWDWARTENRRLEDLVKWHEQHRPEESLAQWKRMYDARGDEIERMRGVVEAARVVAHGFEGDCSMYWDDDEAIALISALTRLDAAASTGEA